MRERDIEREREREREKEREGEREREVYTKRLSKQTTSECTRVKFSCSCFLLIFLHVSVKPTLSAAQTTVQALKGSNVKLGVKMAVPVYPPLLKDNFTWFNESGHVVDKRLVLPNGSLNKVGVTVADTGDYTCLAVNAGGSGSTVVRLEVLGEWTKKKFILELLIIVDVRR